LTDPFVFSVAGTPRPQPRPRFVKGRAVSTANPKAKLWRAAVERAARAAVAARGDALPLFRGAVRVTLVFTFLPPAGAMERVGTLHTHKPDADNISKGVLDLMERAGVFKNDSQVALGPPEKWWGLSPGVSVLVEDVSAERREEPGAPARMSAPDWLRA
jgi:Holliday junction resolvase RusA-like endonuclease